MSSLYKDLGGSAAVTAAVDLFYQKVLADPSLLPFFEGVDMERQKMHQRAFLTLAFGGPEEYSGRGMKEAHARLIGLGLNDGHFDAVVGHLAATLSELGVPNEKIQQAGAVAESVREQVLGRA